MRVRKGEHTCSQKCLPTRSSNCDKTCSKVAERLGDHRCSVQVHICGSTNCVMLLDIQRDHSVHKCVEVQCLRQCFMRGCKNICGEKDHFHGQLNESRMFAEENVVSITPDLSEDSVDDAAATHMCLGSHACPDMCQVDGICEQKEKIGSDGSRCTWILRVRIPGDEWIQEAKHAGPAKLYGGLTHSCIASTEQASELVSDTQSDSSTCINDTTAMWRRGEGQVIHFCDTYFIAKDNDIDIEDQKYFEVSSW